MPVSRTIVITKSAWAVEKSLTVTPDSEDKKPARDDKEIQEREQKATKSTSKKKATTNKTIGGESSDKNHDRWIDVE